MGAPPVRVSAREHLALVPRLVRGDLVGVLEEVHRRHGPVVDFGYGSARMILVFGAEANEHVLSKAAECFEWGEAMQALVAVDGPTALVVSDGEDHRRRRRLVQPAFSVKRVDAHLGLVVDEVDREFASWRPGEIVDAGRRSGLRCGGSSCGRCSVRRWVRTPTGSVSCWSQGCATCSGCRRCGSSTTCG